MAKKVTIFIGSLDRGGAETHILRTFPQLDRTQFDIRIFCLSHRGLMADDIEASGLKVSEPWISGASGSIAMELIRLPFLVVQLLLHFLLNRPDIAHFFLPANYLIAGPLAWLCGVKVRIMSRRSLNDYQKKKPKLITHIEHWLHQKMHAVLGNSQKVVDQLIEEEGVQPDKAGLIYNGLVLPDLKQLKSRPDMRKELGLSEGTVVMTIVANLIPYKGHRDLLRACAKLSSDTPDWHLLIVGNDSAHILESLKEEVEGASMADKVTFLGPRHDVFDLLNASDMALLVSHEEGFSNAVLEAMACKLPMVVTDVGGNPEAVLHETTGLVVPPKSVSDLSVAVQRLLESESLRQTYGQKGFERVRDHFSMDVCVKAYEAFYSKLLS